MMGSRDKQKVKATEKKAPKLTLIEKRKQKQEKRKAK